MLKHIHFIEKTEKVIQSYKGNGMCYLFYADIAEFQLINRYYGMDKGDALLYAVELFLKSIPEVMVFERILSDQFVFLVITQKSITKEQIKEDFHKYARIFVKQQKEEYPDFNMRIACGIYEMKDYNVVNALDGANLARKEAKKKGSVAAVVFDNAILDEILNYHKEEQETNLALKEKRFKFFLQPKVNLLTGEITGAEALARRVDVNGKVIYPDRFLQIMETNGSIVALDELILEQVCQYIEERRRKGMPVVRTSVNLSRLHVQSSDTAARLHQIVEKYHVPPELIEFELTETILLNEFEGTKKLIDQLRSYQHHVSIDDFGAGYAGINIWQELNFDILKLDRGFLSEEEPVKSRNAVIVPNVINIAQRLGIDVICEGVETEEQCKYLLQLGCTTVQGFFFSRPVPREIFYETYEMQEEKYHSFSGDRPVEKELSDHTEEKKSSFVQRGLKQSKLIVVCTLFLVFSVFLIFFLHRKVVTNMFMESVENNLASYTTGQAAVIEARMNDIKTTMNAFAILMEEENNEEFIDTYVTALNEHNPNIIYMFSTAEQFEEQIRGGNAGPEDIESINKLRNGENVISDIFLSKEVENQYCFSIGIPVFMKDEFAGGLRAIVKADVLTSTEQYVSPYGEVEGNLLVDEEGNILALGKGKGLQIGENIFEKATLLKNTKPELRQQLLDTEDTKNFKAGEIEGVPYYISVIDLNYNNWKNIILFKAGESKLIIDRILYYTLGCCGVLMMALLVVCVVIVVFQQKWKKKTDNDAKRYLLLEQFSDTVLFDYDCRNDIIRFTPNITKIFQVQEWTHRNFLARLSDVSNIYPADRHIVRGTLNGEVRNKRNEIRVRIKHSSEGEYYWCLLQYKYFYEGQNVVSVVGKIVDIDEQQRRENQLEGKALRDGLTELYNKVTTQEFVEKSISEKQEGLLFMIDIDNFKQVNDTYGHSKGDRALRCVSECLRKAFRSDDIVGRIGGDELLVYMQKENNPRLIHQKMKNLWNLLCKESEKYNLSLSISVGVAACPEDGISFEELFRAADRAMYRAKENGKQQYCIGEECYPLRGFEEEDDRKKHKN